MKLSKTSWIILTIGIIVVAFGVLGIARAQQVQQQKDLDDQLSTAELRLDKFQLPELRAKKADLQQKLEQNVAGLEAAKNELRQQIASIDVTDNLFDIATASGVEITNVSSSELGNDNLEGIVCTIIRLSMIVEGDVPDIIDFVINLNSDFNTGIIKSLQINIMGMPGEQLGEDEAAQAEEQLLAGEGSEEQIADNPIGDNATAEEPPAGEEAQGAGDEQGAEEEPPVTAEEEETKPSANINLTIYAYRGN